VINVADRFFNFGAYPVERTHVFAPGMDDGTASSLDLTTLTEDPPHA